MNEVALKPVNQRSRIAVLRASFLAIVPFFLLVHPLYEDTVLVEVMEQTGLLLIIFGVLGRFWSILYIGGHKNAQIVRAGPYSMCRHPLYLFSSVAALGFGLMLQSIVLAILISIAVFTILSVTATKEEVYLQSKFGPAYGEYAASTPRIIPRISLFETQDEVVFSVRHLRTNFVDALVFIVLIPLVEVIEWIRESGILPSVFLP